MISNWPIFRRSGWQTETIATFVLVFLLSLCLFSKWDSRFIRIWRRDLTFVLLCVGASLELLKRAWENTGLATIIERVRRRDPRKTCFLYGDAAWSYQDVEDYSNRVAQYFLHVRNLKRGECVALFATSSPHYVAIWLGLHKIGCLTAFINSSIKGDALIHAITSVQARLVIVSADLLENFHKVQAQLQSQSVLSLVLTEGQGGMEVGGSGDGGKSFDDLISAMPKSRPDCGGGAKGKFTDQIGYIYTSGTTGLSKPCFITARRMFSFAVVINRLAELGPDDCLYCTLPLYHTAGGMIAVGQALLFGSTVVIRKKFSASTFWVDIARYNCTAFQYIGEMCRYLLRHPSGRLVGQTDSLRIMFGQGLRSNIWKEFVETFKIPVVLETYGSTEGNVGLANLDGKVGAIGFTSWFIRLFRPQYLIVTDESTGTPVRGSDGFCIQTGPGVVGELVGRISWNPFTRFDGYLDKRATEKKILSNVFRRGDRFFRTGDLMTMDEDGYISFVDRSGDTFRWKGENVSAAEVENVIINNLPQCDVAVFGVVVPGCEGKAGMMCLSGPADHFTTDAGTIADLNKTLKDALPDYARPLFVRIIPHIDMTGTLKISKTRLKAEAYDPSLCSGDPLWYLNRKSDTYLPMTPDMHKSIVNCTAGF
ncbi:Long-chain fatty acid transport protein 4 [Hypsibius exemplaris]|uniref:Long-chain-fatty-acid--CoA ligase n=1 Tax=Hypsibius exemplaris TaxID=2072580 RepID=A0A9X6NEG7_HYPEX|nr:Long-chain fatty acid transport protein 4 [Hypsibius exemplaris]